MYFGRLSNSSSSANAKKDEDKGPRKSSGAGADDDIIMSGTLEKASRDPNNGGIPKGWRHRWFVLNSQSLSYYIRAGGEKKGTVRVKGGAIRRMSPEEAGGRPFCIELQEGRDLSVIDADLLDEARRLVRTARQKEIEENLRQGIENGDVPIVTKYLEKAELLFAVVDFALVAEAKAFIQCCSLKNLKQDIRSALQIVSK